MQDCPNCGYENDQPDEAQCSACDEDDDVLLSSYASHELDDGP